MTKDKKTREMIIKNIKQYYDRLRKEFKDNNYYGPAVKTEEDKINVLCRCLYNGFWPNFEDKKMCPQAEEIKQILFPNTRVINNRRQEDDV